MANLTSAPAGSQSGLWAQSMYGPGGYLHTLSKAYPQRSNFPAHKYPSYGTYPSYSAHLPSYGTYPSYHSVYDPSSATWAWYPDWNTSLAQNEQSIRQVQSQNVQNEQSNIRQVQSQNVQNELTSHVQISGSDISQAVCYATKSSPVKPKISQGVQLARSSENESDTTSSTSSISCRSSRTSRRRSRRRSRQRSRASRRRGRQRSKASRRRGRQRSKARRRTSRQRSRARRRQRSSACAARVRQGSQVRSADPQKPDRSATCNEIPRDHLEKEDAVGKLDEKCQRRVARRCDSRGRRRKKRLTHTRTSSRCSVENRGQNSSHCRNRLLEQYTSGASDDTIGPSSDGISVDSSQVSASSNDSKRARKSVSAALGRDVSHKGGAKAAAMAPAPSPPTDRRCRNGVVNPSMQSNVFVSAHSACERRGFDIISVADSDSVSAQATPRLSKRNGPYSKSSPAVRTCAISDIGGATDNDASLRESDTLRQSSMATDIESLKTAASLAGADGPLATAASLTDADGPVEMAAPLTDADGQLATAASPTVAVGLDIDEAALDIRCASDDFVSIRSIDSAEADGFVSPQSRTAAFGESVSAQGSDCEGANGSNTEFWSAEEMDSPQADDRDFRRPLRTKVESPLSGAMSSNRKRGIDRDAHRRVKTPTSPHSANRGLESCIAGEEVSQRRRVSSTASVPDGCSEALYARAARYTADGSRGIAASEPHNTPKTWCDDTDSDTCSFCSRSTWKVGVKSYHERSQPRESDQKRRCISVDIPEAGSETAWKESRSDKRPRTIGAFAVSRFVTVANEKSSSSTGTWDSEIVERLPVASKSSGVSFCISPSRSLASTQEVALAFPDALQPMACATEHTASDVVADRQRILDELLQQIPQSGWKPEEPKSTEFRLVAPTVCKYSKRLHGALKKVAKSPDPFAKVALRKLPGREDPIRSAPNSVPADRSASIPRAAPQGSAPTSKAAYVRREKALAAQGNCETAGPLGSKPTIPLETTRLRHEWQHLKPIGSLVRETASSVNEAAPSAKACRDLRTAPWRKYAQTQAIGSSIKSDVPSAEIAKPSATASEKLFGMQVIAIPRATPKCNAPGPKQDSSKEDTERSSPPAPAGGARSARASRRRGLLPVPPCSSRLESGSTSSRIRLTCQSQARGRTQLTNPSMKRIPAAALRNDSPARIPPAGPASIAKSKASVAYRTSLVNRIRLMRTDGQADLKRVPHFPERFPTAQGKCTLPVKQKSARGGAKLRERKERQKFSAVHAVQQSDASSCSISTCVPSRQSSRMDLEFDPGTRVSYANCIRRFS